MRNAKKASIRVGQLALIGAFLGCGAGTKSISPEVPLEPKPGTTAMVRREDRTSQEAGPSTHAAMTESISVIAPSVGEDADRDSALELEVEDSDSPEVDPARSAALGFAEAALMRIEDILENAEKQRLGGKN